MTHSHLDPAMQNRVSWNAGRTVGTKRPLTPKQIWAIRFFLDRAERFRDRALFDLTIDCKLRGCDLLKLKIGNLVAGSKVRDRAMIIQRKTGHPCNSETPLTTVRPQLHGFCDVAAQSTISCSRAEFIPANQ